MPGNLEPRTLRLTSEEWDNLDDEAEDRGFENRTEYIRWIIRNRNGIEQNTAERLNELEERLDAVEAEIRDS